MRIHNLDRVHVQGLCPDDPRGAIRASRPYSGQETEVGKKSLESGRVQELTASDAPVPLDGNPLRSYSAENTDNVDNVRRTRAYTGPQRKSVWETPMRSVSSSTCRPAAAMQCFMRSEWYILLLPLATAAK